MPDNRVRIIASLDDKVSAGVDKIRTKLDDVGGKGTGSTAFGVVAAKGLDLIGSSALGAGQAIGSFIHDSIQSTSDLNETISKAHVVFGKSTDDIEKWGKTAATSMGLSENAAIGAAASIGNLLLSTGTAEDKIAPMSKGIVQLASDLASFNNIPVEDALAKLQSGLVGQERPLRELGVAISAASVDTEAAALGFHKLNGEFSEGEKVQARYALIFKQTATAQGDFARTSDQLANSQRKANAEMEDASATLGEKMLPAQLAVTNAQIDFFSGLNVIADGLAGKVTPAVLDVAKAQVGLDNATRLATDSIAKMDDETLSHAVSLGLLTDQQVAAERSARRLTTGYVDAKDAEDIAGKAADDLGDRVAHVTSIIKTDTNAWIVSFDRVRSAMLADAQATVSGYFDPIITQDKLAATNAAISAQRRILASNTATTAEKADARAALHQLGADQRQYLEDLASAGGSGSKAVEKAMASYLKKLASAHGEERRAIEAEILVLEIMAAKAYEAQKAVQKLPSSAFHGNDAPAGQGSGGRAGGGALPEGLTRVGEHGEELEYRQGSGVYVLPHMASQMGSGGGGGGSTTVVHTQINLDGRVIANVVSEHLAYEYDRSSATSVRQ